MMKCGAVINYSPGCYLSMVSMIINRKINDIEFAVDSSKASGLLCTKDVADQIDGSIFEFIEYIYEKGNDYVPLVATWEITNTCNFKCPFCYINTPAKPKSVVQSFKKMQGYIDDLVQEGLLVVYLTGGEVLSVPDFPDIYRYLKNKGVFVVLLTNLSLLNDEHIRLFEELPPLRITSSIYGITEKQFKSVTGKDFSVGKRVFNNIERLKEMGINITCQMPVNKYTVNDLIDISNWCYNRGIRFTFNNELTDSYYDESRSSQFIDNAQFEALKSKIKQIELPVSTKNVKIEKKFGYKHHFDCVSGKHTFAVSYEGHLRPCFNIWETEENVFDGSVSMKSALYKMKAYIKTKQAQIIEGCHGCEASGICGECVYTRGKHMNNLDEYIRNKCRQNMELINRFTEQ